MIAPRTLTALLSSSPIDATKAAIVAELGRLMTGVKVVSHPGKLDINDVVAKSVVAAPGVAVGWTRIRAPRDVAGTFSTIVEWAAYVVVEDYADRSTNRSISRDALAHAIGSFLLEILDDTDASCWGLTDITPALQEPPPQLVPLFTAKSADQGTAYYAVTWSQTLIQNGASLFDGETPEITGDQDGFHTDEVPEEIRRMLAGDRP